MTATCQNCGAARTGETMGNLCPKCLLEWALRQDEEEARRSPGGSSPGEPPDLEALAEALPDFEILGMIGRGGMGFVYRARQRKLDRLVAIKVLPLGPRRDAESRERFLREARALAQLNHPNIVTIHDVGESGDFVYFVMEHVEGASLAELLRSGDLPPWRGLQLVPQMCDALDYAHRHGVVHRDITPGNVLVDRHGRVKIADFGIAKLLRTGGGQETGTIPGETMGTPGYVAPEQQADAQRVDHRVDIYSLGAVIYEMLTGELPVGRFEPPSKKVRVDVRLDEVVLRALDARPERRYQNAGDVKREVEEIANSKLPASGPGGTRRKAGLSIAAVAVLLLAATALVVWNPFAPKDDGTTAERFQEAVPASTPAPSIRIVGTAQEFGSISEALAAIKAGQTIEVAGTGEYRELVRFVSPNHRDVTLVSTDGATVECPEGADFLLGVINVSGVTVRGFHLRTGKGSGRPPPLVVAGGRIAGLRLEDLVLESAFPGTGSGMSLEMLMVASQEPPVVVRNCIFRQLEKGIRLSGIDNTFQHARPGRGVLVVDNSFRSTAHGITVIGAIHDAVIAGNSFYQCGQVAIRLQNFFPQSGNLLVANNTMLGCGQAFRLFDDGEIDGSKVRIVNNLTLEGGEELDWAIYDCPDPRGNLDRKPGDGLGIHQRWQIDHNFRESPGPPDDEAWKAAWIPPGEDDHTVARLANVERHPNRPGFLQPPVPSIPATGGAGGDLPSYIGAVAPDGTGRFQGWDLP